VPEDFIQTARLALDWFGWPGEDEARIFERVAEWFYRETYFIRPGKDVPLAMYQDEAKRKEVWANWCNATGERVRRELLKFAMPGGEG
jgi:hypothetical protein